MRLQSLPLEALLDAGGDFLSEVGQYGGAPALSERARTHAWLAQIGVRGGIQVVRRLDLHASVAAGLQSQTVRVIFPQNQGRNWKLPSSVPIAEKVMPFLPAALTFCSAAVAARSAGC